jgi:membrane protein
MPGGGTIARDPVKRQGEDTRQTPAAGHAAGAQIRSKSKATKLERWQARLEGLYARLDRQLGGRLSLLVRTALAFDQDDGPVMARSIAYYALFAVFPGILALLVAASTVLESEEVRETVIALVSRHMPVAIDLVAANVERLLQTRERVGLIALIGLLWSASGVFSAIFRAVNRAWGIPKSRLVLSARLYGLALMTVLGCLVLLTLAIGPLVSFARAWEVPLLDWQPFAQPGADRLVSWLSTLLPPLASVAAFTLMYRTMPRAPVRWRDVWWGGLIAGLIWDAGTRIFSWYVGNVAAYNVIYGSVGAIIAFLLWSYLSAQVFLLGAEFTAEYSRWRRAGRPVESRPLGEWMAGWSAEHTRVRPAVEEGGDRL